MSTDASLYLDKGAEGVEIVVGEVARSAKKSIRLRTSSIQIAFYPNIDMLAYFINILKNLAIEQNLKLQEVNLLKDDDLFKIAKLSNTLYIVYGLHSQIELVRRLNWKREVFTDENINILLLVNYEELVDLGNRAPDFWAFKNRFYVVKSLKIPLDRTFDLAKFEPSFSTSDSQISVERGENLKEMVFGELFDFNGNSSHFIVDLLNYAINSGQRDLADSIIETYDLKWRKLNDESNYLNYILHKSDHLANCHKSSMAIKQLKNLLRINAYAKSYETVFLILEKIVRISIKVNDIQSAKIYARKMQNVISGSEDKINSNMIKLLFAEIAFKQKEFEKSLEIIRSVDNPNDGTLHSALLIELDIYFGQGNPAKALDTIERYYSKLELADINMEFQKSVMLARAYQGIGDYEKSLNNLYTAIKYSAKVNLSNNFIAALHFSCARCAYYIENYELAETEISKVLDRSKNEETNIIVLCYDLLGSIYQQQNNVDKSLKNYIFALKLTKDEITKVNILNNIAKVYIDNNRTEKALEYSKDALVEAEKLKNLPLLFRAKLQRSIAISFIDQEIEAISLLCECETYYRSSKNAYLLGVTLERLGLAYFSVQNYTTAIEKLLLALELYKSDSDKTHTIYIMSYLADANYLIGQIKMAIEYAKKAFQTSVILKNIELMSSQLVRLSRYYLDYGNIRQAMFVNKFIQGNIRLILDEKEESEHILINSLINVKVNDRDKNYVDRNTNNLIEAALGIDSDTYLTLKNLLHI